jgi:predicted ribonuclease YlaK
LFFAALTIAVITELHGLGNNAGSLGDSAKSAMIAINKAIAERKDVKIVTAKGNDVTKIGFFREKLERIEDDDETRNIDDIIIRTTRQQAQSRRQAFAEKGVIGYGSEPAILLTEDTNMRVKANARGVPAISTTILKRFLVQISGGRPAKAKSQPPSKSTPRIKRKTVADAVTPRIKSEYDDEEDDMIMADIPDTVDPMLKMQPKRKTKRGRTADDIQSYTPVQQ